MILPPSKLPNVGVTIFTQMSQLANEHNAVNLSQGFPDYMPNENLIKAIGKYAQEGYNQYAPLGGIISLREEIAKKMEVSYHTNYHPETEITVTAGATQAIFTAIGAFIQSGDEVILFEPAYDCYEPTIQLFGGIVRRYEMRAPDYSINWDHVKKLITTKTKMIVLNNPNNPSGKVLREEDIQALIQIVHNTNIIIVSDDVYENIVFDGRKHLSISQYPELRERSIIVASFGKLFHITGWKVGYCVAPKDLMIEFRKVHQYNVFCVNTPAQMAIAEFMIDPIHYQELSSFFQQKRDLFRNSLSGSKFKLLDCEGTYFQSAKFDAISNESDIEFARNLTIRNKVASIPFSAFYKNALDEKVIRFCFAKKNETILQGVENLLKASENY